MRKFFCWFTSGLMSLCALCSLGGALFYDATHHYFLLIPEVLFAFVYAYEAKHEVE